MDRIAFISGDTFVYWGPIILALAGIAAAAIYAAFYLVKSRNFLSMGLSILMTVLLALPHRKNESDQRSWNLPCRNYNSVVIIYFTKMKVNAILVAEKHGR